MVGLLLLKQTFGLSDEQVCDRWVYDPYFQYFIGAEFFAHEFPHERSGISFTQSHDCACEFTCRISVHRD